MQMGKGNIQKEGMAAFCFSAHEVNRFFGQLTVDQAPFRKVVFGYVFSGLACKALHHLRYVNHRVIETW